MASTSSATIERNSADYGVGTSMSPAGKFPTFALSLKNAPRTTTLDSQVNESRSHALEMEIITAVPAVSNVRIAPIVDPDARNRVAGVIRKVEDDFIQISAQLSGREEMLQMPLAIIPEELRRFALPVWLELDNSEGYRRIVVKSRQIVRQSWHDKLDDLEREIDAL